MKNASSITVKEASRRSWLLLPGLALLAALAILSGPCQNALQSAQPASSKPVLAQPHVAYLDTTFLGVRDGKIYLRGWFRITSPPEREYEARFQLLAAPTEIMKYTFSPTGWWWGSYPVNMPKGEWTPRLPDRQPYMLCECDGVIPVEKLELATNLPRGQRSEIRAQSDIWDRTQKKYLGHGVQTTLVVRTDEEGKVLEITGADKPWWLRASKRKECVLPLKHLQLVPGVTVEEEPPFLFSERFPVFRVGNGYAKAGSPGIFRAVDTKAGARELAELCLTSDWGEVWVVKTADEYRKIKSLLGKRHGALLFAPWHPPSHGFTVQEGRNGSFIVRVLFYDPGHGAVPYEGVVFYQQMSIWPDGRVERQLVPVLSNGRYERWQGVQTRASMPSVPELWKKDPSARALLADNGLEVIPYRVLPKNP